MRRRSRLKSDIGKSKRHRRILYSLTISRRMALEYTGRSDTRPHLRHDCRRSHASSSPGHLPIAARRRRNQIRLRIPGRACHAAGLAESSARRKCINCLHPFARCGRISITRVLIFVRASHSTWCLSNFRQCLRMIAAFRFQNGRERLAITGHRLYVRLLAEIRT